MTPLPDESADRRPEPAAPGVTTGAGRPPVVAEALRRLALLGEVGECLADGSTDAAAELAGFCAGATEALAGDADDRGREEVAAWILRESSDRWGDYLGLLDPASAPASPEPPPDDAPDPTSDDAPAALDPGTLLRLLIGGGGASAGDETPAPLWNEAPTPPAPATPASGLVPFEVPSPPASLSIDPDLCETFLAEGSDLFDRIETLVLGVGRGGLTADSRNELGRCFHTLKGAAGSVGLVSVAALVHSVEEGLDAAPGDSPEGLIDGLHKVLHYLDGVFLALRLGGPDAGSTGPDPSGAGCEPIAGGADEPLASPDAIRAAGAPTADAPGRPIARGLTAGVPHGPGTEAHAVFRPSSPPQEGRERLHVPPPPPPDAEASPNEGPLRVPSERIDELMDLVSELITRRGLWAAQAKAMKEFAAAARSCRARLSVTLDRLRDAGAFNELPPPLPRPGRRASDLDDLTGLLRRLAEQAEDLATLTESAQGVTGPLLDNSDAMARTTLQLWESLQAVRIVPVRALFQRLARVAHDAARVEGRQVAVAMVGEETGLDRAVQDKAFEPLLHVVRNAVSHGIEPPAERERAGKPATGRVTLEASRAGNTLVLSVRDDGRGLDYAAIEAKGRRIGLIAPGDAPGTDRLGALIFRPGFSTRDAANSIAGRGVGMDVVSQEVGRLHGTVELDSQPGQGTRLSLRLPARLSLQQAVILRVAGRAFALPVELVELAQPFDPAGVDRDGPVPRVQARGEWVPLVSGREALGLPPDDPASCPKLLLIRADGGPLAVLVDAIEGARELVVKPLGPLLSGHPVVSGTSLSVSGEVVLTLNPSGLARRVVGPAPREGAAVGRDRAAPVLVVDDSISVRKAVARHLRSLGLEVEEASDGLEALGRLRAATFGLVVSDLEMPRMDGFELLAEVGRLAITPGVPVVVASTRCDADTRRRVLGLGASEFLPKPIDPDAMTALVRSLLPETALACAAGSGSDGRCP